MVVTDIDGDTINATWHYNDTNNKWFQYGANSTVASGVNITQDNSNFTNSSATYYWSVNISDGEGHWVNETYHFTTEALSYNPSKGLNITIESDYIDESLTNFPILIVLNSTISQECDNGKSISFNNSANTTTYNHEIEGGIDNWNDSGNNYIHYTS